MVDLEQVRVAGILLDELTASANAPLRVLMLAAIGSRIRTGDRHGQQEPHPGHRDPPHVPLHADHPSSVIPTALIGNPNGTGNGAVRTRS